MYLELFSDRCNHRRTNCHRKLPTLVFAFAITFRTKHYDYSSADRRCFATTLSKEAKTVRTGIETYARIRSYSVPLVPYRIGREKQKRARSCNRECESSIRSSAKIAFDKASTRERIFRAARFYNRGNRRDFRW